MKEKGKARGEVSKLRATAPQLSPAGRICRSVTFLPSHCLPPGVKASLSDTAQPRDAGGPPRAANASRDRIVGAVIMGIKISARQRQGKKKKRGGGGEEWARQTERAEEA
jgi:hypothetical protein